jgi:hypothetical protein
MSHYASSYLTSLYLTTASSGTVLHISPMRVSAAWRLMPESCFVSEFR